jgi:tRNA dimethylallyltransferase
VNTGATARTLRGICLAGPTASGKTALALALAQRLPLEIVSVDSALVYRGMDIGSAKPGVAERAAVPHHLIDILDPTQAYSAARFVSDARRCVEDVRARGRLPLLVGGTMLYFKALREGLSPLPEADPGVRAQLEHEAVARGWPALHAELARVDAASAARLAPNDAQRIQRALEVWRVSGRSLTDWHQATAGNTDSTEADRRWPMVSLEPASRGWLHERIAARFEAMLRAGLLDEVRALQARGDLHPDLPAMRCVGYRQAWQALCDAPDMPAAALQALRERGIAATRQLAKRQLTWLRGVSSRQVVACDAADAVPRGLSLLEQLARTG